MSDNKDLFCVKCKKLINRVLIKDGPGFLAFEDGDFNERYFLYLDLYDANLFCNKCNKIYNNKKIKNYDLIIELDEDSFDGWELFTSYQDFEERVAILSNDSIDVGFDMKECECFANVIINNKKIYFLIDKVL
jgi:hypothetical protein